MSDPLGWRSVDESAWRAALEAGPSAADLEAPGLVDWAVEATGAVLEWVLGALGSALPAGLRLDLVVLGLTGVVVAVALALSAVLVYRILRRRPPRSVTAEVEPAPAVGATGLAAADWRSRLADRA